MRFRANLRTHHVVIGVNGRPRAVKKFVEPHFTPTQVAFHELMWLGL